MRTAPVAGSEQIRQRLQELGVRGVAVFDDEVGLLEAPWFADGGKWEGFFDAYRGDLDAAFRPDEVDVMRRLEPVEARGEALAVLRERLPEQVEAYAAEAGGRFGTDQRELHEWVATLEGWGLSVGKFRDWADFEERTRQAGKDSQSLLQDYQVILLDHDFGPERGSERHSLEIARHVGRLLGEAAEQVGSSAVPNPPLIVKFSARRDESTEASKLAFVREARFARGCYEFLQKAAITRADFAERFLWLVQNADIGRRLYAASLDIVRSIRTGAASAVMDLLYELNPDSIRVLSEERLRAEGVAEADYLVELFVSLLYVALAEDDAVADATKHFLDELPTVPLPGAPFDQAALSSLQHRLLFNTKVNRFRRPVDLGDILVFDGDGNDVGLVITQRCDMAVRGQRSGEDDQPQPGRPAVGRVELLAGRIVDLPGRDDRSTRYFAGTGEPPTYHAIDWDWKNPVVLPRLVLDLVTLSDDGQAMLPLKTPPTASPWWTEAYSMYVRELWRYLKGACRWPGEAKTGRIVIPSDGMQSLPHALGSAASFEVQRVSGVIRFPFRRVARLRQEEALRLQQHYHAEAGRIGVLMDPRTTDSAAQLTIANAHGVVLRDRVPARRVQVRDSKWSALLVSSSMIEELGGVDPAYEPVARVAARFPDSVDLESALREPTCDGRYDLTSVGKGTYRLRPKHPASAAAGSKFAPPHSLDAAVAGVLAENAALVAAYRGGDQRALGTLRSHVMKAMRGTTQLAEAERALIERLGAVPDNGQERVDAAC